MNFFFNIKTRVIVETPEGGLHLFEISELALWSCVAATLLLIFGNQGTQKAYKELSMKIYHKNFP